MKTWLFIETFYRNLSVGDAKSFYVCRIRICIFSVLLCLCKVQYEFFKNLTVLRFVQKDYLILCHFAIFMQEAQLLFLCYVQTHWKIRVWHFLNHYFWKHKITFQKSNLNFLFLFIHENRNINFENLKRERLVCHDFMLTRNFYTGIAIFKHILVFLLISK